MKRPTGFISTLLLTSLLAAPALAGADWPMFKYNPAREGRAPQRPAITRPHLRWKAPVGVAGWLNSPVIADGMVFVGSGGYLWDLPDYEEYQGQRPTDGVYAFDLRTGQRNWYAPAENDVNNVVWADGKLIATGDEGAIWALDPRSGKRLWRTELKGIGFQLLPLGRRVIVGDDSGQLAWVDIASGKITASSQLDGVVRSGAASDGQTVFTATLQGTVYAYDLDGRLKWKQSLREIYPEFASSETQLEIYGAPTVYKDMVVLGFARDSYYDVPALVALDRHNGGLRWKGTAYAGKSEWGNIRTSPAVFNNMLFYAEPYSNTVVAVDGLNGKAAGGLEVGAPMFPQWSSPAIAGDTLYVPRYDGGLYAIDANKAQLLWSFYLGSPGYAGPKIPEALLELQDPEWKPPIGDAIYASPAIAADGSILIPAAGFLYCISEE
ncbi:MAG: PQQ-binding-like beta-propeller repeat protein [Candidatus Sericytochromatia bacterium]